MPLALRHQNKVQFLRRLRDKYRAAERFEACRLAWRVLKYLDDGDVTETQMLNAWGFTQVEWIAKRTTRLQPRADKWAAYQAALDVTATEGTD